MTTVYVGSVDELSKDNQRVVEVDGEDVLVVHTSGQFFAVSNICSHQELEISGGPIEGGRIKCVHHGSWFDLETGRALNLPAVRSLRTYKTLVEDGHVYLEV